METPEQLAPTPDKRNWFKVSAIGLGRFLCMVTGIRSDSPHHAASLYVLFAGLFVEIILINNFLMHKSQSIRAAESPTSALIGWIVIVLLLPLFLHQFMIVRNFTLMHAGTHDDRDIPFADSAAFDGKHRKYLSGFYACCFFLKSIVEFCIYLLFGVISGEAGYLYAVGSVNASKSGAFTWVEQNMLGSAPLREALEGLFVIGALSLCMLVVLWDVLVAIAIRSPKGGDALRTRYERVLVWFFVLDFFSLALWMVIGSFIFPYLNNHIGEPTEFNKFIILIFLSGVYLIASVVRLWKGIRRLGKEPSLQHAKLVAI